MLSKKQKDNFIKGLEQTLRVLFNDNFKVATGKHSLDGYFKRFYSQSSKHPRKGYNNAPYEDRVKYWFRSPISFIDIESCELFSHVNDVLSNNSSIFHKVSIKNDEVALFDEDSEIMEVIPIEDIFPIFPGYFNNDKEAFKFLEACLGSPLTKFDSVNFLHEESVDDLDPHTVTEKQNIQKEENMKNTNSMVQNFASTMKSSMGVGATIGTGNAANAGVKAVLRPILRPALLKLVTPKGMVSRMIAGNKVEETVDIILDSPMMDVMSAMILVTIASSGVVENKYFLKGTSAASDAAMVKLANLIDFDAIVKEVVSKTSDLVTATTKSKDSE
jgi:hypothetical protein